MRIVTCVLCTWVATAALASRSVPLDRPVHNSSLVETRTFSGLDSTHYVIIPYSAAYKDVFSEGTAASCNSQDLELLQQLVEKAMHRYNAHKNMLDLPLEPFDTYYFQLMPVSDSHGEKTVWVNAFCSLEHAGNWRKQRVSVHGGGSCFFTIKVNLNSRKTYDMMVNPGT